MCECHEKPVAPDKISIDNGMALEESDAGNKLAKVEPVLLRQYQSKKSRTKAVHILLEFPSLVSSIQTLCRVLRRSSKRQWQEWHSSHHGFTVCFPKGVVLMEYSSVPSSFVVWMVNIKLTGK